MKAAKEALSNGGGKRAFRKAAEKAKEKRSSSASKKKPRRLFTLSLTAQKEPDGAVTLTPEVQGEPSPKVRSSFEAFCRDLRTHSLGRGDARAEGEREDALMFVRLPRSRVQASSFSHCSKAYSHRGKPVDRLLRAVDGSPHSHSQENPSQSTEQSRPPDSR